MRSGAVLGALFADAGLPGVGLLGGTAVVDMHTMVAAVWRKFLCFYTPAVRQNLCVVHKYGDLADAADDPPLYSSLARTAGQFTMAKQPTLYDLVLLLSVESEEEARTKLLADVESAITGAEGTISLQQAGGRRPTTFPINHQSEAEYHLLQFTGPTSLLESLEHSLRIADEVLRFRIIKVVPGTPDAPEGAPPVLAGAAA